MRLVASFAALTSLLACSSYDSGDGSSYTGSGTGGGPGSTSGMGQQCDQGCVDSYVAYAIDSTTHLLYNQNIAGQPGSPYDKTGPCPGGGTAHVTGTASTATTTPGDVITSVDLSFDLLDCKASEETFALTVNGAIGMYGTYTTDKSNALTFSSESLTVDGTVFVLDQPAVTFTCPVSLADTFSTANPDQEGWLNGSICGRPVSL